MNYIIFDDMEMQMNLVNIIKPKQALLKFRVSYEKPITNYFDSDIYFQVWRKYGSI